MPLSSARKISLMGQDMQESYRECWNLSLLLVQAKDQKA